MNLPAAGHPEISAAALAREMAGRGVPRSRFIVAVNSAVEEMVQAATRQNVTRASVYRYMREYRTAALEEFDRFSDQRRNLQ